MSCWKIVCELSIGHGIRTTEFWPSRFAFFTTLAGNDSVSVTGLWFPQNNEFGALSKSGLGLELRWNEYMEDLTFLHCTNDLCASWENCNESSHQAAALVSLPSPGWASLSSAWTNLLSRPSRIVYMNDVEMLQSAHKTSRSHVYIIWHVAHIV